MDTFDNAVALRIMRSHRLGLDTSMVEKELKIMTNELGSIVVNTAERSRISGDPTEFKCSLDCNGFLVGNRNDFNKVSHRVNNSQGKKAYRLTAQLD